MLVVDNVLCTPALQRPLALGADFVMHSATKYLDGQGRVLGGAVCGAKGPVMDGLVGFLRTAGPTHLAVQRLGDPRRAWKRWNSACSRSPSARSSSRAGWRSTRRWRACTTPGLESHPQHALAMRQQRAGGAVVSFDVKGGKEAAWKVIDSTKLISITGNLGDVRTTITHPATTTHGRITPEARAAAGITDGLIRLAVGLEAVEDLKADLARPGLGAQKLTSRGPTSSRAR